MTVRKAWNDSKNACKKCILLNNHTNSKKSEYNTRKASVISPSNTLIWTMITMIWLMSNFYNWRQQPLAYIVLHLNLRTDCKKINNDRFLVKPGIWIRWKLILVHAICLVNYWCRRKLSNGANSILPFFFSEGIMSHSSQGINWLIHFRLSALICIEGASLRRTRIFLVKEWPPLFLFWWSFTQWMDYLRVSNCMSK